MTRQLRAAGALAAATGALLVLGVPLMILLVLDPSAQAACGGTPTGPGPSSVPGIPPNLLPIFEGAAQQFELGNDGWAYLAALNYAESDVRYRQRPRHRACCRAATRPGRPGRCRSGSAARRPTTGTRSSPRSRRTARRDAATQRVQRGRRRLRRRRAPEEVGRAAELAGGARGLEQLPARDRAGHPARRAVHPNRPGEQRRARGRDVDRARTGREARDASRSAGRRPPARSPRSCPTGWRRSRRARRPRCRR